MQKRKRTVAVLATIGLMLAFIVPAQAQPFGEPQPFEGPDGYGPMGGPMGMGSAMPFMSPFMGMFGRQSEMVAPITRLPGPSGNGKDLMATLESMPQLSMFTAALKATGYDQKLTGAGDYVVFAPVDKAITRDLAISDAGSLAGDPYLVKGLVEACIAYRGPQQNKEKAFTSLNGKPITLLRTRAGTSANGADVLSSTGASNGFLIVTDGAVGT